MCIFQFIFFSSYHKNLFIVSNVIFIFIVGIIDVFFTMTSIKRWGMSIRKGDSFFSHFIAMNSGKNTTLQLLAKKGDNEVVIARLVSSTKYGTHNALP